ncbi:MAG: 3'-5' exonuclease, partial [Rickettsiales bacterium]
VAGVDRMVVTESIAVQDLLALCEFLLLPEDDLSLACVLKSPLCGLGEEALFALAYQRGEASLWSRLQRKAADDPASPEAGARAFLNRLLEKVDYIRPYELLAHVLETEGGRQALGRRLGDEVFDPLEEFLALSLTYEQSHTPSLQGFLQWLKAGEMEVKRDLEQGVNAVRIMTVHGAKGLQAPIVFLPDTTDAPRFRNRPLWSESGEPTVLWSPSAKEDDPVTAQLRADYAQAEMEEYCRLLYVAMTRAEDRLYVCGWQGARTVPEDCWYSWIKTGMESLLKPCALHFADQPEPLEGFCYETPQEAVLPEAKSKSAEVADLPMPSWVGEAPAPEPFPPQPLVPSRLHDNT